MNTTEIVDQEVSLVDGAATNDAIVRARWVRNLQRAVNFVWNDRPWSMKLKTASYTYNPGVANPMPDDFESFESKGAGLYCRSPRAWLVPMDIGELKMLSLGTTIQTQAFGPWTRWSVDNEDNGESLKLWFEPPTPPTFDMVYLKRPPVCVDDDGDTDELFWIPTRWHELLKLGAEYFNGIDIHTNQVDIEQGLLKLGLDQMRERQNWTAGYNNIVPYRRNRLRAS